MATIDRRTSDAELGSEPADHVAAIAQALSAMGELATAISTRQQVAAAQAALIRRFLPALADRYGLEADSELRGDVLTVTFSRAGR